MKLISIFLCVQLLLFANLIKSDRLECDTNSNDNDRVDCYPETWTSAKMCESRGCCWREPNNNETNGVPYCYYPQNYVGYDDRKVISGNDFIRLELTRAQQSPSGFPNDFTSIFIYLKYINEYRALIRVLPQTEQRWTPPIQLDLDANSRMPKSKRLFELKFDNQFVKVIRKQTNQTIWKMNYRNLILSDQWLQAETHLPSLNLFGLGEYKDTFFKNLSERKSYIFFTQGDPPFQNRPLYSAHPMYLAYEANDGGDQTLAHTVLLLNSNAAEAALSPGKILVWRTIGGQLDFYINLGSDPIDAVSKYVALIGKPPIPPYWSLGFHLSRYGFNNLNNMKLVYQRMKENEIPLGNCWLF